MLESIATLAGLLGLSAKELLSMVARHKAALSEKQLKQRVQMESSHVTHENVSKFIGTYYGAREPSSNLGQYSIVVNGNEIKTTVFVPNRNLNLAIPLESIRSQLGNGSDLTASVQQFAGYAARVAARLENMKVNIWNQKLYRMLDVNLEKRTLSYSETDFVTYRFTSGLLEDELIDYLIDAKGNMDEVCRNSKRSPLRKCILPDLKRLADLRSRVCGGGIGVVFALRQDDYYSIPLQVRSPRLSDGRNRIAVLPKAFHQPMINSELEISLQSTLFRELFEEVFGGEEVTKYDQHLVYDWYFGACEPLQWFRKHDDWHAEVVGFGLNAVAGNFDFGMLVVVEDESYYESYRHLMRRNWEATETRWIATNDADGIARIILEGNWVSESLLHFTEGLRRLKELHPNRVSLPDICRIVGGDAL
jgi:hypothetical protein